MLLRKIEALRKEPKEVRNRYAFGVALVTTLMIAVVWGVSVPARFSNSVVISDEAKEQREEMGEQLLQIRDLVTDSVEEIKTQAELVGAAVNSTSTREFLSELASTTLSATSTEGFVAAFASSTYATTTFSTSSVATTTN